MRTFDVDLGSIARLIRRPRRSGHSAVAGSAAAAMVLLGLIGWVIPKDRQRSEIRRADETGGVGVRDILAEPGTRPDLYSAVAEAWYALDRREVGEWPDPFGEPASPIGGRVGVAEPEPEIHAVWRQKGGRMAVIDGRVVREGGVHRGYRVERCVDGAVWLTEGGLCRRREIRFRTASSALTTERVPP